MKKTVGLAITNEKMFEFEPFEDGGNPAAMLYVQAKAFYSVFRMSFGNGYITILGHDIPNTQYLGPCIVNYHFSVELMLKSLIALKGIKQIKTHCLIKLLEIAKQHYPQLDDIYNKIEIKLLLKEISAIGIRYAEGTLFLRHNICKTKKPLQELSEAMEYTFLTLIQLFEFESKKLYPS